MGLLEAPKATKLVSQGWAHKNYYHTLHLTVRLPCYHKLVTERVTLTLGHTPTSRKFQCNELHCKSPHNPQPNSTSFLDIINLTPRDPGLAKEIESLSSKELSMSHSSSPANFMSKNSNPQRHRYLQKYQSFTNINQG